MTPEQAKKDNEKTLEELRKEFEYWQNYLAQGGHGAQVSYKLNGNNRRLSLCGGALYIEGPAEEDRAFGMRATEAFGEELVEAAKHLEELEEAVLARIANSTDPMKAALASMPKTSGRINTAKIKTPT